MRPTNRLGSGIGLIALAASFALASPGVKVVPAETLAAQQVPAQCHAAAERQPGKDAERAAFLDRLRSQQPQPARGERPDVVVLNNRGYNYGSVRVERDAILAAADARR